MSTERALALTLGGLRNLPVAVLAAEQRGVVGREQLLARGWSGTTIDRRLAERLLTPLWPATYAYGNADLTRHGWLFAATLACGEGSHLVAHASAAARGLLPSWSTIDVRPANRRGVDLAGLRPHFMDLRPEELDVFRGLPVTSLARTALDVAATGSPDRVGALLDEALLAGQYDHAEMAELLGARRGCRGVAILRQAVAALGDEGVVFRSRPERLARDLIVAAALPAPRVNAWFPTRGGHGYELDLWYPTLQLDFEIDGARHRLPRRRKLDALRDADLRSFGIQVVRLPDTLVLNQPEAFVAAVRSALQERELRMGPRGWG